MCDRIYRDVMADAAAAWKDAGHPRWHLTTPSHCMIDCWGAVYHRGYYHMFVDVNPHRGEPGDESVFWHVRSKDLLHWEHLPLPLLPDAGELRTNDGWVGFDDRHRPILLYTGVPKLPETRRFHRAAVGDDDLLCFERVPGEPFMTLENHGGPVFYGGWSDPYVFEADGKRFLLVSKCVQPDGGDPLPVYEADDGTLQRWHYRGNLFEHNGEVVNFFPLGDKWVLIYSPYQAIEAFVGTLDTDTMRFRPQTHGILSYGYHSQSDPVDRGFYATCVYRLAERTILCGWISGFHTSEYWEGCMGVPRELSLSDDLRVIQRPIEELRTLREPLPLAAIDTAEKAAAPYADMADMELVCRFTAREGYLKISIGGTCTLTLTEEGADCCGDAYPLGFAELHARILLDKTVCELFFGDSEKTCGVVSATRCFPYVGEAPSITVESDHAAFHIRSWRLKETPQAFAAER